MNTRHFFQPTLFASLSLIFSIHFFAVPVRAETGVTDSEIRIGSSLPLSGSVSGLGTGLQEGFQTYFDQVNAKGGVHGRKIVVAARDDGYDPERSAKNAQELINNENSFALFTFVGTPTSRAAVPLARKFGVPYLFPFTGAEFLRTPADPLIFNLRASYFDETETLVDHMVKDLGVKRVAIFAQADAYGDAGLSGVVKALAKRNMKLVGEGRYKRNGSDIGAGYDTIKKSQPEAVILIGAYEPCAEFIKRAKADKLSAKIANISFVGTENLIKATGEAGEGTYVTQIMPSPEHSELPIVQQYRKDMGKKSLGYTSLEGYVNAAFLTNILEKNGKDLTRANFLKTINQYSSDIGGLRAAFSPKSHQAFTRVYLTQLKSGKAVEIDKM